MLSALFKQFLDEEHAAEHLLFWLEAEIFKSVEDPVQRKTRAIQIYDKYLTQQSK